MKARALSIRQPWASLIVRSDITDPSERERAERMQILKTIENRNWPTRLRGGFLVHAAKGMTEAEYRAADDFAAQAVEGKTSMAGDIVRACADRKAPRGGIVGYAELVDCISSMRHEALKPPQRSAWFIGEYGFQLANIHPLPFMPTTGRLGFFEVEVPEDYLPAHLRERIAA